MSAWFNYAATFKILVFSLLVGAGLPALFALGVRLAAAGSTSPQVRRRAALVGLGWVVFALVLTVVLVGVLFIARDFIADHTGWHILGAMPRW